MNRFRPLLLIVFLLLLSVGWVSAASPGYKDTLVVAADGSGDCSTFAEAFEKCRAFMDYDVHIIVRQGVYREKVILPSWLQHIIIEGEDAPTTILTWDDHANLPATGTLEGSKLGTFRSYTLRVDGSDIIFRNITIENNAPQLGQAVALHTQGDKLLFIGCRILGNQDTVYTGRGDTRLYFYNCYIEGTTDFIFGPSTAWFEQCAIHCKRKSYITAASTPENVAYGYVFNKCRVTFADDVTDVKLGRPWRDHASTFFLRCDLGDRIAPEGWAPWNVEDPALTVRYGEYACTGASASTASRVPWSHVLTRRQAKRITPAKVLGEWWPEVKDSLKVLL